MQTNWKIFWLPKAQKNFSKLDLSVQKDILSYIEEYVMRDPIKFAKPLQHELFGLWRYRIGKHRLICEIKEKTITITVIQVGIRKDIYD